MAKEQFTRTKPHVRSMTMQVLARQGVSPPGIFQVTQGLIVTDPNDRLLVAEMMNEYAATPLIAKSLKDNTGPDGN